MKHQVLDEGVFDHKSEVTLDNIKRLVEGKKKLCENEKAITHGQYAIMVLIVMQIIASFIEAQQTQNDMLVTGINIGLVLTFIGALMLTYKYPKPGFLVAIVVFGLVLILAIIGDPMQLIRGILWKGFIVYYMVTAFNHSSNINALKKELSLLG